jgi:hypothetical protein
MMMMMVKTIVQGVAKSILRFHNNLLKVDLIVWLPLDLSLHRNNQQLRHQVEPSMILIAESSMKTGRWTDAAL